MANYLLVNAYKRFTKFKKYLTDNNFKAAKELLKSFEDDVEQEKK